jgi:glycogen debranching enzyme
MPRNARAASTKRKVASPGEFRWNVSAREAVWIVAAEAQGDAPPALPIDAEEYVTLLRKAEQQRRRVFSTPLHLAADAYIVRTDPRRVTDRSEGHEEKNPGKTIIAGYPWFTDWGRDTFIAMRGLCLAIGRLDIARDILLEWAATVSEGMVPNRFPDRGSEPEFNSVDASLWYIIAIHEFLQAAEKSGQQVSSEDRTILCRLLNRFFPAI